MRVSISAIGSVTAIFLFPYQLALRTPGSSPVSAMFLKQMRQSPKCLMYAFGLPQLLHLLCSRTLNFFGFFQLAIFDFFAMLSDLSFFDCAFVAAYALPHLDSRFRRNDG